MYRMVRWRRGYTSRGVVWTTRLNPHWDMGIDLSFTLEAGMRGSSFKNARLLVRKRKPGGKAANDIIMVKDFDSSYRCKNYIDGLLTVSRLMFENNNENGEAEKWVLEQLSNTPDTMYMPSMDNHGYTYNYNYII